MTTSLSAGVSALASTLRLERAAAGGRLGLRVPDGRADLACAGAARRRDRARAAVGRRDPGRAVRRADRRADGARLDHGGLLPERRAAAGRGDRGARALARRARPARRLPGDRLLPDRRRRARRRLPRRRARSSTCSPPPGSGSSGAAASSPSGCSRPRPAGSPTGTSSRWTSTTTRPRRRRAASSPGTPPIPAIYAGIAGIELISEIGIAETRAHVTALNERLIAGVDELGGIVATPRDPEQRGALVCIRLDRRARARAGARRRADRHLGARRQPAHLGARLQRRERHRRRPRRARAAPRAAPAGVTTRPAMSRRFPLEPRLCSPAKLDMHALRRSARRSSFSARTTERERSPAGRRSSA